MYNYSSSINNTNNNNLIFNPWDFYFLGVLKIFFLNNNNVIITM